MKKKLFLSASLALMQLCVLATALALTAITIPRATAQPVTESPPVYSWPSYEDRHTFRGRFAYFKDEYIWAYTREFAQRFRMPEQWINAEIKGGLVALAWRMTPGGKYQSCGIGGKTESCLPTLQCQLDIYIDNTIVKIEWTKPEIGREVLMRTIDSMDILREPGQPDAYRRRYGTAENAKPGRIPVFGWGIPSQFRYGENLKFGGSLGDLTSYDHVTYPGLTLLSRRGNNAGVCPPPKNISDGYIQSFDIADSKRSTTLDDRRVVHSLHVPASFYSRIRPAYELLNKENEEAVMGVIKSIQK